ncbi:hypothetical protein LPB140_05170 [Sphingorhabdus lutea]|uniref:Uncharacterized protein n=1 Tax=Sphingorhabdus lutea TaxID=1913578 RepID=A0A1L3JAY4_9SPHN|nr:hypothetical protein [Sphingorhabdus lutea]APG62297.1 hypothetical protein LPB140_05170 [Sphingorhabdus lutea]
MKIRPITSAIIGSVIAQKSKGSGIIGAGLGMVAGRIASKSLPGAALIGGLLIGKTIYDARKNKQLLSHDKTDANIDAPMIENRADIKAANKQPKLETK